MSVEIAYAGVLCALRFVLNVRIAVLCAVRNVRCSCNSSFAIPREQRLRHRKLPFGRSGGRLHASVRFSCMVAPMKCSIALQAVCSSGHATRTATVRDMLYLNDQITYVPFVSSFMMRQMHNAASCCSYTAILAPFAGAVLNDSLPSPAVHDNRSLLFRF